MKNYIIEAGDTISAIAKANGISQKKLLAANQSISDANDIKVGDQLSIPEKVEDPATQDALSQSNSKTDGAVEECPLQAEWLTIKPLRYAVADEDSELGLPEGFKINSDMPILTKHKYISRELADHVTYLYNPEEHYLLEVIYDNNAKPIGRCVFGQPESDVTSALPLLKQKKGCTAYMWLTHAQLTDARAKLLEDNPQLIKKAGRKIDFAKAAKGSETDTFPLFDIKKYLAELFSGLKEQLSWTASPLLEESDENALVCDYNNETPNNSYAVCLVDPITITGDLCREFSIGYDIVMNDLATTQHPFQMAELTKAVIEYEANKSPKFNKERARKKLLDELVFLPLPQSQFDSLQARLEAEKKRNEDTLERRLAEMKERNKDVRDEFYKKRKIELKEHVYYEEMEAYLKEHPEVAKRKKVLLEELAKDWVSWLKDAKGILDLSLTWLDDADEKQRELKETLIASMVHNINAFDNGTDLAKKWTDYIVEQLEKGSDSDPVQTEGVGAHLMISMGYISGGVLYGSSFLASFNSLLDSVRESTEKYAKLSASTQVLQEAITPHMVAMGNQALKAKKMWDETIRIMSMRADVEFLKVDMPLNKVVSGINASNAALMAANLRTAKVMGEAYTKVENRLIAAKSVSLYDLDKWGKYGDVPKAEKNASSRFFAKYMKPEDIYSSSKNTFSAAYKKTDTFFSPSKQAGIFGLYTLLQLYNSVTLYASMDNVSSEKELSLIKANFYSALFNVVSTSITVVDKLASKAFGGTSLTTYFAGEGDKMGKGAVKIGKNLEQLLKDTKFGNPIFQQLKSSSKTQMAIYEALGRGGSKFIGFTFRSLPLIGATFSTYSSYRKRDKIQDEQNETAVTLSTLSMVVNGSAIVCFLAGMVVGSLPAAALTGTALASVAGLFGPLGVTLLLLSLGLDMLYDAFADDEVTVMLKRSFWGKGSYKYAPKLETLEDRITAFSNFIDEARESGGANKGSATSGGAKKTEGGMVSGIILEQRSFCDYLFKPVAKIEKKEDKDKSKKSKDNRLSHFIIQIYFPGFIKWQSDVEFSMTGRSEQTSVKLATNSRENTIKNDINGRFTMTEEGQGLLQFEINEAELSAHKVKRVGQVQGVSYSLETETKYKGTDEGKGMNYQVYNLSVEYKYPAGFPVVLNYPKITIDDDKGTVSFE